MEVKKSKKKKKNVVMIEGTLAISFPYPKDSTEEDQGSMGFPNLN